MAAIDYSIGFTQTEVEEILTAQKAELKKTLAAYANDGSSVTKRRVDEIHAVIAACQRALQKLAPETYGKALKTSRTGFVGHLEK
jgi:hypothetical protein